MPDAFGYNANIGFVDEAAWGDGASRTKFAEIISESIKATVERKETPSTRDLSERRRQDFLITAAGSIEMELIYEGLGTFFKNLFGSVVSAVVETAAFGHTFSVADVLPPGMAIEVYRGDDAAGTPEAHLYAGCKVVSMTISFEPDEPVKVTFEIVSKVETIVTKTAVTFPDLTGALLVKGHDVTAELDDGVTTIDSAEITFSNGIDTGKRVLGSQNIAEPVRSERRIVTGTITADWIDKVLYEKFIAGTAVKLELIATSPTDVPGSTTPYSFTIQLPKIIFDGETPSVSSPGILKQPLPFFALKTGETATTEVGQIIIVNALTTI